MNEEYSGILVEFYEKMSSWENGIVADRAISLPQMHLLEVVGNHGPLRMKDLSETLGVTTGTLTVMVHRLVSKGYLLKEQDSDDRRSFFVQLTPQGREEYRNHHIMHGQLIEEIVAAIGEEASALFFGQLKTAQEVM